MLSDVYLSLSTYTVDRTDVVSARQAAEGCEYYVLRAARPPPAAHVAVEVDDVTSYGWVERLRDALKRAETEDIRVYAVSRLKDR